MPRAKGKKTGLSVEIKPLSKGGFFDIEAPEGMPKLRVSEPKGKEREKGGNGFGYFFAVAFGVFIIFATLGLVFGGQGFLAENKNVAYAGYESLRGGLDSLKDRDFKAAKLQFAKAEGAFSQLSGGLGYLSAQGGRFLQSPMYLESATRLIESGRLGSEIGRELTEVLEQLSRVPEVFLRQNTGDLSGVRLTDLLREQGKRLGGISVNAERLSANLESLSASPLPSEVRSHLAQVRGPVTQFLSALGEIRLDYEAILRLLGDRVPHRYLVLFQNNHELRATGGFIGSYMLVDVNDGVISKLETKDVYETDGQLVDVVPPPPGIDWVADRLYMRDANYSPDFPTSAKQIMWFLEHSQGPSVDTVIAIDQTVAERFLEITGPVVLGGFPFQIRSDNFNDLFSFNIESKQSESLSPKQLMIDFIPQLKQKLIESGRLPELADIVLKLVSERHIQAYSSDPEVQSLAERAGLDGRMVAPAQKSDFLALVTTAIGGNKSDAYIHTSVDHHSEVGDSGRITDRLTITKSHTWKETDFSEWQKLIDRYGTGKADLKTLRYIQGEGGNMDYLRVYVPKGSRLTGFEGADVNTLSPSEDLGYTVFAFPFGPVAAGQSKTITLSYELPFALSAQKGDVYRFIAQPQAGSQNVSLRKTLGLSDSLKVVDTFPKTEGGAFSLYPEYETPLDSNKIFLSSVAPNS